MAQKKKQGSRGNTAARKKSAPASSGANRKNSASQKRVRSKQIQSKQPQARAPRTESDFSQNGKLQTLSDQNNMTREIICWVLLGISALIFLCVMGLCGKIGNSFGDIMFGLFGLNAFIFPFLLFLLTLYIMTHRRDRIAIIRTFSIIGLFVIFCAILQLIGYGQMSGTSPSEFFDVGKQYHEGGGLIGGGIVLFFSPTIGLAGTWLVLLIAAFILIALITQKDLFVSTGRKSSKIIEAQKIRSGEMIRERSEKRAAEKSFRRAQQEARRVQRETETAYADGYEPDTPVFFSVLNKDHEQENAQAAGSGKPKFTTELFGNSRRVKGKAERISPITPDQVVFSSVTSDAFSAPEKDAHPASSEGLKIIHDKFASNRNTVRSKSESGQNDRTEIADGSGLKTVFESSESKKGQRLFVRSAVNESASQELSETPDPGKLSASFRINRAEPVHDPSDMDASDVYESDAYESDPADSGQTVTAEDIQNAGVQAKKKKTSEEKIGLNKDETQKETDSVAKEIRENEEVVIPYEFPSIQLLEKPSRGKGGMTDQELRDTAAKLQQILATFGVNAQVTNVSCGPSVTRYELLPELGTKVSKITNLADDIKLNLAAADIRIEAPIPGKAAVGIEVPNEKTSMVYLRELIDSDEFRKQKSKISYVVGKDIAGRIIVSDIAKMPHLLIAGATGSGKSVFINTLIMSILYNADPADVKMIMIDPKVVELSVYNGIPHLFIPVVTDPKKAAGALNWGVAEMTKRYQQFAECGVRNLAGYNAKAEAGDPRCPRKLPQILIIVDELADLMMVSGNEVEDAICRLAQLARACGIHLVIATQRPSVDVITGLIKANVPSRIAFAVSSGTDSRTILDMNGAEKLLGNGDMLFAPQTYKKPVRVQGAFVSDEEIQRVIDTIRVDEDAAGMAESLKKNIQEVQAASVTSSSAAGGGDTDELFADAGKFIIQKDKASIGMLQRWFKIGFNRAARIMDQLADAEVVGPEEGTKPRKVLMTEEQFENYLENN